MHLRDCFYKGLIVAVCSYFCRLYMQIFSFSFWAVVIRHACYTNEDEDMGYLRKNTISIVASVFRISTTRC